MPPLQPPPPPPPPFAAGALVPPLLPPPPLQHQQPQQPITLTPSVQSAAIAAAQAMAAAITAAAPASHLAAGGGGGMGAMPRAAPQYRSLDEVLARERARIAAADQRNMRYVLEQQAASKARAKAEKAATSTATEVAEAAEAPPHPSGASSSSSSVLTFAAQPSVASAYSHSAAAAAAAMSGGSAPPPAKMPRLAPRSHAGNAAACSVYVAGLPLDVHENELEVHMSQIGPVVRVKLYRDAATGRLKGDALVTYQKDAAVLGAVQLLSGVTLRPGHPPLTVSRPVWGGEAGGAPSGAVQTPAAPPAAVVASSAPRLIPGLAPVRKPNWGNGREPPAPAPLGHGSAADTAAAAAGSAAAAASAAASAAATASASAAAAAAAASSAASAASAATSETALRVVVVRRFFLPSEVPPASDFAARRAWTGTIVDELWSEACKHGEIEQVAPLLDGDAIHPSEGCAAIRFTNVVDAAAAVDALDGRFFAERSLAAGFDDGRACRTLPAGCDLARQQRFGFGEMAEAFQESLRVLRLASAEGASFIACATFLCDVEHYAFRPSESGDAPHGAGYYRHADAPPPDPYEQAKAILVQASEAGAAFVACAEPIAGFELALYEYRNGPDGLGYYRSAAAPPSADPIEQARLILREAAAAGAEFVRTPEFVGPVGGYDYLPEGARGAVEGGGYYRRPDAPPPDTREYSRIVLQRASAAGADFVRLDDKVMDLPGYDHRDGPEGVGYYRRDLGPASGAPRPAPPPPGAQPPEQAATSNFDDFMSTMRSLGAV